MKKIVFVLILSATSYLISAQCPTTNGTFNRVSMCSLTVSTGPVVFNPNVMFGSNISLSGSITAGTWNGGIITPAYGGTGYNSFSAALSAYGVASGYSAITWPDTLTRIMTTRTANDSIAAINGRVNTKLSAALAAITYQNKLTGSALEYTKGDGTYATLNTDNVIEATNQYFTTSRARAAFSSGTGISISSGVITNTAPDQTVTISGLNGTKVGGSYPTFTITDPVYTNSSPVSGGAGQAVFYLTSDKTSSGTALYSSVDAVIPIINDANQNYTYGWSYNSSTKALTVTAKVSSGIYVSLLNLTLLGAPTVVANGTTIYVVVKGN